MAFAIPTSHLTRLNRVCLSHRAFRIRTLTMSSKSSEQKNASGLTPNESKNLNERQAMSHEEPIIRGLKELYSCKPKDSSYSMYTKDAVFHDPVGIAQGVESIRAQFNGLAKLFPRADIPRFRILENPPSVPTNVILIDQDVSYYRNPTSTPTKTVNSLLTLETNDSHQVTRHTEEWNHKHESTKDDGFIGMLNEERKKMTANLTAMLVGQTPPQDK